MSIGSYFVPRVQPRVFEEINCQKSKGQTTIHICNLKTSVLGSSEILNSPNSLITSPKRALSKCCDSLLLQMSLICSYLSQIIKVWNDHQCREKFMMLICQQYGIFIFRQTRCPSFSAGLISFSASQHLPAPSWLPREYVNTIYPSVQIYICDPWGIWATQRWTPEPPLLNMIVLEGGSHYCIFKSFEFVFGTNRCTPTV